MRIISGKYKGRIIKMPKGIRPTQDKVRKALFDILGDIDGLSFLELFAGSGAVGFEAVSQGAKEVVFVEKDKRCIERIKENLCVIGLLRYPECSVSSKRRFGMPKQHPKSYYIRHRVIALDVFRALKQLNQKKERFDIIFLDPPYYKGLAKKSLLKLSTYDILKPNGVICIQHYKKEFIPEEISNLRLFKRKTYGETLLSFYKK